MACTAYYAPQNVLFHLLMSYISWYVARARPCQGPRSRDSAIRACRKEARTESGSLARFCFCDLPWFALTSSLGVFVTVRPLG